MSIHFDQLRWKKIEETYYAWWNGTLGRPVVKVTVRDAYQSEREKPKAPLLSQLNWGDFSYSPEELIDSLDYELSKMEFLGDAFPYVNMAAFGPASLAGFCGAQMDNSTGSVWYFPKEKKTPEELTIRYDPNSVYARRIKEIYRAGQERWGGNVLMSMPDLGGFQDVLAVLLGSEELIYALYEEPEEIQRLSGEVYSAFVEAYEDFSKVLFPKNPGYSDWGGLFSKEPSYILQDDFAYMISPAMFQEFALQDIVRETKRLKHTIYHLDGIGNLNHLDALLGCKELDAIQWVYGAGQPGAIHWREVYNKIAAAGKNIEIIGSLEDFSQLSDIYGDKLFYHLLVDDKKGSAQKSIDYKDCLSDYHIVSRDQFPQVLELLKKLGI